MDTYFIFVVDIIVAANRIELCMLVKTIPAGLVRIKICSVKHNAFVSHPAVDLCCT